MSGAAFVLVQHARRADCGYSLKLQPARDDFPSKDATADTARVMAAIEAMARAAPAQYLWIHRRFNRTPDAVSPYVCRPCGRGLRAVTSPPAPPPAELPLAPALRRASCRGSGGQYAGEVGGAWSLKRKKTYM